VEPLSVKIDPGAPTVNPVPIWAPAGALQSTLEDMSIFAAAALGRPIAGMKFVKPEITKAFQLAQKAYACQVGLPTLCPQAAQVGLSWAVFPPDAAAGYPSLISKNGGVPGFSTQIDLMPTEGIGVVVFANSFDPAVENAIAATIARNIISALHYTMKGK
jgi:CubicO group peptidase (beta-lactamase class C family)